MHQADFYVILRADRETSLLGSTWLFKFLSICAPFSHTFTCIKRVASLQWISDHSYYAPGSNVDSITKNRLAMSLRYRCDQYNLFHDENQ